MLRYMLHVEGTPQTLEGLIADPGDRLKAVGPIFEAVGGKLEQYYLEVGGNSSHLVVQVPDQETLAALTSALYASGALRSIKATGILTSEEAIDVFKKAATVNYQPPSA